MENKLPGVFYLQNDVCRIATQLLGKELVVSKNGKLVSGIITETEAYAGVTDKASHAYQNKRTARTEVMYAKGGVAYIYLCYGIHYLFNIVTNRKDIPEAVLVRSVFPRRGWNSKSFEDDRRSGEGPGRVSKILGISKQHNGADLSGDDIFILNTSLKIPEENIFIGKRIGVDYAEEDALLPYRFFIERNYLKEILYI